MTRVRLREARPEGEAAFYAERYPDGYRHDGWPDHRERVAASVQFLRRWQTRFCTAADLSCGDAAILRGLAPALDTVYLGDVNDVRVQDLEDVERAGAGQVRERAPGALPDSLDNLPEPVDLFVLSETLEHMDDPDGLLRAVRDHARYLFVSTPLDEPVHYGNAEHYWSWGKTDVHEMLQAAGWSPLDVQVLEPESTRGSADAYAFQMWLAVRA